MDYLRVIAGISSYLIILIIGLVLYVVSLKQDQKSVSDKNADKKVVPGSVPGKTPEKTETR